MSEDYLDQSERRREEVCLRPLFSDIIVVFVVVLGSCEVLPEYQMYSRVCALAGVMWFEFLSNEKLLCASSFQSWRRIRDTDFLATIFS